MKTITCTGCEDGVSMRRGSRRRSAQRFLFTLFGMLLLMTANSSPALADGLLFQGAGSYGVGQYPNTVAIGDFNGDGKLDLITANNGKDDNNISVLLGNGNGTFQDAVNYGVGTYPDDIAVGDFNGDGKSDIAVLNKASKNVSILLGAGNGTFPTVVNYSVGEIPDSIAVGDFNGDGKSDLAATNAKDNNVSILLGNGDGTFRAAVNYGAGTSPNGIAVGDFNCDGKPDLATANFGGNNVSVLLGVGNGTFPTVVNYSAGSDPGSIAAGDFNCDGKPDLAVANYGGSNISVLLGVGEGTFQDAVNYSTGSNPCGIALDDLNGDGRPDLTVVNAYGQNVSVLLGKGDGTFRAADNYGFGDYCIPESVAAGDFNGDGKPDLAVAVADTHKVTIMLNNSHVVTNLELTGAIPDLTAHGDVYDLNNLTLTGRNQLNQTVSLTGLPVTWTCSGTTGSITDGHYLKGVTAGTGDTVTASVDGVTSTPVSFKVLPAVDNANLSALAVTPGSIDTFDPDTAAYVVDYIGTTDSLAVTATADDNRSVITVGGQTAASGGAVSVHLDNGANLIPVVVTAADGQTQKAYVLSVNGTVSDAALNGLSVSTGVLSFAPDTFTYNLGSVDSSVSGLNITANPHDSKALMFLNGSPMQAGAAKSVELDYGANSIEVMVVAQDATTRTYTISVTRTPASITWNTGSLSAEDIGTTGLTLTWPAASCDAGIGGYKIYQGTSLLSTVTASSHSYNVTGLSQGTSYDFSVTAINICGGLDASLTLTVSTEYNSDAALDGLSASTGVLSFDPAITAYDLGSVDSAVSSLTITAGPHDSQALMFLNGSPMQAGAAKSVELDYGANSIEVMVVAQDATTRTYTISVTRAPSAITWGAGSLSAEDIGTTGLTLTWPAASCDAGIGGYKIYQGASLLSTVTASSHSYNVTGLNQGTSYDFSVTAADAYGGLSTPLTLTVGTKSKLEITTAALPGATVKQAYSAALEAGGGTAPYTWSIDALPEGLVLDGAAGTVTGTPTATGTAVVNVTLTDSTGLSTSQGFQLNVLYPSGTGKYIITPDSDLCYTVGATDQGIATMTVNSGTSGFVYFTASVEVVQSHSGDEAVVFRKIRNGTQLAISVTRADFEQVDKAMAAFNVNPGDVIEVYIVDDLSNSDSSNPSLLQ